jgi:MinD superfamily P-loop ATPase
MIIGITGGKGGTGKSTVSVALSYALVKKGKKVLLVDADVECPNDHLLMDIKINKMKHVDDVLIPKPVIDKKKCIKCGTCVRTCREAALYQVPNQVPQLLSEQCTGCGACFLACPVNAISEKDEKIGEILKGNNYKIDLLTGIMVPGYEEASPVVNKLINEMEKIKDNYEYLILDTAPGTHCNVISSLRHVNKAFAVTEPTPLGAHDLDLILSLSEELNVPMDIVVNRSGIGKKNLIDKIRDKHKIKIVSHIPYDRKIVDQYCKGKPIEHEEIDKIMENIL